MPTEEQRQEAAAAGTAAAAAAKAAASAATGVAKPTTPAAINPLDFAAPVASMGAPPPATGASDPNVLDPVLMAGGALDQLEKTNSYSAGLEAAAAVARRAVEAQNKGQRQQMQVQVKQEVVEETAEEKELRRQLGGFVAGGDQSNSGVSA